jgi:cell wall-associated NlpC family hydrolase
MLAVSARPGLAQPQISDVDRQIAATSQRLEALVERYDASQADIAATQLRVTAVTARLAQLGASLDAARSRVGAVAVWAYETSPASEMTALLTAGSPAGLIDRLMMIENLARTQQVKITGLADLTGELNRRQATLRTLMSQQIQQHADLATLTAEVKADLSRLRDLRAQLTPASRSSSEGPQAPPPPVAAGQLALVLRYAYAQLGKAYEFGAAGPGSFDCSGLTMAAWRAGGVDLPHNAARQYDAVPHLNRADLRPGDLVFYYWDIHHVALYVGHGWVIHAPMPGETVRLQPIDLAPIHGYGRPA